MDSGVKKKKAGACVIKGQKLELLIWGSGAIDLNLSAPGV